MRIVNGNEREIVGILNDFGLSGPSPSPLSNFKISKARIQHLKLPFDYSLVYFPSFPS